MPKQSFTAIWSKELAAAIIAASPVYNEMALVKADAEIVRDIVNVGIDSALEACYVPHRGDFYNWDGKRLNCRISRESIVVLVRRLMEKFDLEGDEKYYQIASDICTTLDIELI